MANFPSSFDSFSTLVDNVDDVLASHQNTRSSAIVALETKVGLDGSADSNSIDYFCYHASGQFRTHTHSGGVDGEEIPIANIDGAVADTGDQSIAGIKTFTSIPVLPASDPTTSNQASRKAYVDGKSIKTLGWFIPGAAAVGTNVSARLKLNYDVTIVKAKAYAKTAPTGSNLIFDINVAGSTIWSTQANRLKITAGSNEDTDITTFNTTTITAGQAITIDIDQIGSTVAGSDITVLLEVTY